MRKHLCSLLIAFSSFAVAQQSSLTFLRADPAIVQQRLTPVPSTQNDRLEKLRKQFLAAKVYGPVQVQEQLVPGETEPNLICTLQGSGDSTIVVAVNAANKGKGDEARVNWATLEMLPLLVESVAGFASRHTVVFVAFNGEKGKYSGATAYLDRLSKDERRKIDAMIELDHIGRMAPSYAPQSNAYVLGRRLRLAAFTLQFEIPQIFFYPNGSILGSGPIADAFEKAKIPAITIYSRDHYDMPQNAISGISPEVHEFDIDPKAYYDTYVLLCAYLRQIDQDWSLRR
jgi:hypothetical protein